MLKDVKSTYVNRAVSSLHGKSLEITRIVPLSMNDIIPNHLVLSLLDKREKADLKGVFAKNERGYRLTAENKRF